MSDDHLKIPRITKLNIPKLIKYASSLELTGTTALSKNKLSYLDIDDEYIHRLFSLLQNGEIKKPDYFGKDAAGAHITIMYPEENKIIQKDDLQHKHSFVVKDLVAAEIGLKTYYVLLVDAPTLLQLRCKYKLPDMLCFKGYAIGFHITIGVIKH